MRKVVITDGAIDLAKTAEMAKKEVKRKDDVPVHSCGSVSHRDCPCWTCTLGCKACDASMF